MAGRSVRRDPTKGGLAGLSADDWAALAEGRSTVGELAAKAGVSPAAVSKARKKQQASPAAPASAAGVAAGGGGPPPTATTVPASATPESYPDPDVLGRSFAAYGLLRAHDLLAVGGLGPAALKAAVAAGSMALEELRRFGVLADADVSDTPVELKVSVMTAEEIAALKANPPEYATRDDDE